MPASPAPVDRRTGTGRQTCPAQTAGRGGAAPVTRRRAPPRRVSAPDRLAEVDVVPVGDRAGTGTDCAAEQGTDARCADQGTADDTGTRANGAAAEDTVRLGVAAGREHTEGQHQKSDNKGLFHLTLQWTGMLVRKSVPVRILKNFIKAHINTWGSQEVKTICASQYPVFIWRDWSGCPLNFTTPRDAPWPGRWR